MRSFLLCKLFLILQSLVRFSNHWSSRKSEIINRWSFQDCNMQVWIFISSPAALRVSSRWGTHCDVMPPLLVTATVDYTARCVRHQSEETNSIYRKVIVLRLLNVQCKMQIVNWSHNRTQPVDEAVGPWTAVASMGSWAAITYSHPGPSDRDSGGSGHGKKGVRCLLYGCGHIPKPLAKINRN